MSSYGLSRGPRFISIGTKEVLARQQLRPWSDCKAAAHYTQAARPRRTALSCSCSAVSGGSVTRDAARDEAVRQEVFDVIATARNKAKRPAVSTSKDESGPLADFARKCKAAYHIFFPPRPKTLSPKEEGRNRLRMILVADRCAMNANSLVEMKTSIVNAVSNYVEIEEEEAVEVSMTTDPDLGTIYSVAVPVKRVKPTARAGLAEEVAEQGVTSVEWDAGEWDADPAARFPWGT